MRQPPISTLFPYTTLFRSDRNGRFTFTGLASDLYIVSVRVAGFKEAQQQVDLRTRSEEHTSELQSHSDIVCRLLLEKKKKTIAENMILSNTSFNDLPKLVR